MLINAFALDWAWMIAPFLMLMVKPSIPDPVGILATICSARLDWIQTMTDRNFRVSIRWGGDRFEPQLHWFSWRNGTRSIGGNWHNYKAENTEVWLFLFSPDQIPFSWCSVIYLCFINWIRTNSCDTAEPQKSQPRNPFCKLSSPFLSFVNQAKPQDWNALDIDFPCSLAVPSNPA